MMKQVLISLFLIFFLYHCATTSAQSSPAQGPATQKPNTKPAVAQAPTQPQAKAPAQPQAKAPVQPQAKAPAAALVQPPTQPPPTAGVPAQAPSEEPVIQAPPRKAPKPGPQNVTEILEKAGGFSIFIRLLRDSQVINQIENQLNASNTLTILAPSNGGFSSLKAGTLNTLTPEQKVQLLQYHILPSFVALQNFETLDNPVRTQASSTEDYPLNITTEGSSVNISTGVVNTTISGTVYSDNQLAIYRVDSVLLPIAIFAPKVDSPAPAPAPVMPLKPKKATPSSPSTTSSASSSSSSPSNSSSSALKPSSNSSAASASASISPVAALDESGASNGVVSVGIALSTGAVAVLLLGQF